MFVKKIPKILLKIFDMKNQMQKVCLLLVYCHKLEQQTFKNVVKKILLKVEAIAVGIVLQKSHKKSHRKSHKKSNGVLNLFHQKN